MARRDGIQHTLEGVAAVDRNRNTREGAIQEARQEWEVWVNASPLSIFNSSLRQKARSYIWAGGQGSKT